MIPKQNKVKGKYIQLGKDKRCVIFDMTYDSPLELLITITSTLCIISLIPILVSLRMYLKYNVEKYVVISLVLFIFISILLVLFGFMYMIKIRKTEKQKSDKL